MKTFKWLESDQVYKSCLRNVLKKTLYSNKELTEAYLLEKGWVYDENLLMYHEPQVKEKYKIWVCFVDGWYGYMIYLGKTPQYYATQRSLEWFELFYLLQHPDNGLYDLVET